MKQKYQGSKKNNQGRCEMKTDSESRVSNAKRVRAAALKIQLRDRAATRSSKSTDRI